MTACRKLSPTTTPKLAFVRFALIPSMPFMAMRPNRSERNEIDSTDSVAWWLGEKLIYLLLSFTRSWPGERRSGGKPRLTLQRPASVFIHEFDIRSVGISETLSMTLSYVTLSALPFPSERGLRALFFY